MVCRKKDINNADITSTDKSSGEPRIVVQTVSEVDIVNDGYRWRKYGQKLVKGNPNPRYVAIFRELLQPLSFSFGLFLNCIFSV